MSDISVEAETTKKIGEILNDQTRPLKERFRALFTLRNLKGDQAIECISRAFSDPSALLKHECAYCLGQMQDRLAIPILENVLRDVDQDCMVRHEAGEALGAIGSSESLDVLRKHASDPEKVISETCDLALRRIEWLNGQTSTQDDSESKYIGVDPTPAEQNTDIAQLEDVLLDEKESLFDRYKAMFALRNNGNREAVLGLCKGLKAGSALYRHEVAFVLGQMQDKASVTSLIEGLENLSDHEMVRHECAEALGAIATEECMQALKKYLNDSSRVVRESCEVALDMCDYENNGEFQYADALIKAKQ